MKKSTIITIMMSLSIIFVVALFVIPKGVAPNTPGPNYRNVTVWTHANITNAKPEVMNVTVYDADNRSTNIVLNAGGLRQVYCNATVRDWDGFGNIVYVNATLWHIPTSNHTDADDNNSHYTNVSCTINETTANPFIGRFVCAFDVFYYANNGTWNCNVTIMDTENKTGWNNRTSPFFPIYALNVTDGIDFGNIAVEEYSSDVIANVTNLGNTAINVSVRGYGTRMWDGLAMNCSVAGNITVDNERFALEPGVAFGDKTPLSSTVNVLMSNLTMPKQTDPGTYVVNSTYWQLYVPPNPFGNCTGYIMFMAQTP